MRACTLVAVDGATVLGTAKIGPNRTVRARTWRPRASWSIPRTGARASGGRSAPPCSTRARADGYRAMQFNAVVETNTAAVRLWQALGFEMLTTVPEAFDHPTHGSSACT